MNYFVLKERSDLNAVLLAIYLWSFTLLKVVWKINENISTVGLFLVALLIISASIFSTNKSFLNINLLKALGLIFIVQTILFMNIIFNYNEYSFQRIYEFIVFGIIPIVLFSQIKNFRSFLKMYVNISILAFLLYIWDPFVNYYFTGNYMVYGYQAILPAFFGLHIGRVKFGYKSLFFFEIIALVMLFFFGNRMAGVVAILFVILIDLIYKKHSLKRSGKYIFIMSAITVILLNIERVVILLVNNLDRKGISSYSLNSLLYYFNGSSNSLISGRDEIWDAGLNLVKSKPLFGHGIGYFESYYGTYVHNIFLDFMISFGVFSVLILIFLLLATIYKVIVEKNDDIKLFGILILVTGFPKLFLSVYYFVEPTFWLVVFYAFFLVKRTNRNNVFKFESGNLK